MGRHEATDARRQRVHEPVFPRCDNPGLMRKNPAGDLACAPPHVGS